MRRIQPFNGASSVYGSGGSSIAKKARLAVLILLTLLFVPISSLAILQPAQVQGNDCYVDWTRGNDSNNALSLIIMGG